MTSTDLDSLPSGRSRIPELSGIEFTGAESIREVLSLSLLRSGVLCGMFCLRQRQLFGMNNRFVHSRPCGADVVRLDTNEVHIGPILASQLCAVIVAGVENHDYLDRDRHAKCRGQHRAQTCRKTCSFIMSRNHYDSTVVDTGYWR